MKRQLACALALAAAIAQAPARADDDSWTGPDKRAHFAASAVIAAGGYALGAHAFDARWKALALGGGTAVLVGAGKELADAAGAGSASYKDFVWDVVGAAAGLGLVWVLDLALRGSSAELPALGAPAVLRF